MDDHRARCAVRAAGRLCRRAEPGDRQSHFAQRPTTQTPVRFVHSAPLTASPPCVCVLLQAIALEQPVGFVYYDGGKVRYCNAPLQSYLEDKMMVGCLIGLDGVYGRQPPPARTGKHGVYELQNRVGCSKIL